MRDRPYIAAHGAHFTPLAGEVLEYRRRLPWRAMAGYALAAPFALWAVVFAISVVFRL